MQSSALIRTGEWGVLLLLCVTALWRGGKGLESTWLVAGVGALLLLTSIIWNRRKRTATTDQYEMSLTVRMLSLLFIVWLAVSYGFSTTQNYGLDEVFRVAGYIGVFVWVAKLKAMGLHDQFMQKWIRVVYWVLLVACVIGAGIYILQPVSRFVGTFVDARFTTDYWPNAWASFVLAMWPMALLYPLQLPAKHPRLRVLAFAGLGIVGGTLLASYSRGGLIACALQLVLLCILLGSIALHDVRYKEHLRYLVLKVLGVLSMVGVVAVLTFFGLNAARSQFHTVQSVTEKVTFTAAEGTSSVNERALFWQHSLELAKQRPLTGWGPYSFRFVQPHYMTGVLQTSDHSHNVFLKVLMELGVIGLGLFVLIGGAIFAKAAYAFFFVRKATTPQHDAVTALMTTSVIGVLLHSMIDFNLQFVGVGVPVAVGLGLLSVPVKRSDGSFAAWKMAKTLARLEIVVACLLLVFLVWEGRGLVLSSFGRHAQAAGNTEEALEWYQRAHGELLSRDMYLAMSDIAADAQNYDQALAYLATYERLNAQDPRLWRMKGDVLLRSGELEQSLDALKVAYDYGKYTDLTITRLLVDVARRLNDPLLEEKKLELDQLFSDYAEAIERNEHFIALSQNPEELQKLARLLSQQYPSDGQNYITIARSAFAHAVEERERFNEAPKGRLW